MLNGTLNTILQEKQTEVRTEMHYIYKSVNFDFSEKSLSTHNNESNKPTT